MAITLLADIDETETILTVTDPDYAGRYFPFLATIEEEHVQVLGGSFYSRAHGGTYKIIVQRRAESTTAASHDADESVDPIQPGGVASVAEYGETHSFQPVSSDLTLDPAAGNVGSNPKFLAAIMGNALGADLTKAGAYVAGVIAALSVTGTKASQYQIGALLGVVMDGVTDADGAVVAVIDGSDPSSVTRANAAFAARMNNNNAGSGVDYGLDLLGPANSNFSGTGRAFAIAKAILRTPSGVCIVEGDAAPVDGTTGAGFAGPGSLYIRTHSGAVAWYLNTGTLATPAWKSVTHA